MQVVSGPVHAPRVHFEAPPAAMMAKEMMAFIRWFNDTAPKGKTPLSALTRAGISHWYFVCVHPFEDGNGRIARALAEKALSQNLGDATLVALSRVIQTKRKAYYRVLELGSQDNEITDWLVYFAETVLEAQALSQSMVDFLVEKTKFFDRMRGQLNERHEKVLLRVFREGPEGFKGGLSAEKYIRITGTSRATATRDLQELVEKKALTKTGALKSTRYHLNIQDD
jgi:Fic family protein